MAEGVDNAYVKLLISWIQLMSIESRRSLQPIDSCRAPLSLIRLEAFIQKWSCVDWVSPRLSEGLMALPLLIFDH